MPGFLDDLGEGLELEAEGLGPELDEMEMMGGDPEIMALYGPEPISFGGDFFGEDLSMGGELGMDPMGMGMDPMGMGMELEEPQLGGESVMPQDEDAIAMTDYIKERAQRRTESSKRFQDQARETNDKVFGGMGGGSGSQLA